MNKPEWQRARTLGPVGTLEKPLLPAGALIWVRGRPGTRALTNMFTKTRGEELAFDTNVLAPAELDWPIPFMAVRAAGIELIPEFADDVPEISWEQFLKENGGASDELRPDTDK